MHADVSYVTPAKQVAQLAHLRFANVLQFCVVYCCSPHPVHKLHAVSRYALQFAVVYDPALQLLHGLHAVFSVTLQLLVAN